MTPILEKVVATLKKKNIEVNVDSLNKHEHQGFMSVVYTAESSAGKLVIHVAELVEPHLRDKVWEKFEGLAPLLASHSEIATPKLLYSEYIDGRLVLVQEFAEGKRAGRRVLQSGSIVDEWQADSDTVFPKIVEIIAVVHTIEMEGYGWPHMHGGLRGPYQTWKAFLSEEALRWVDAIRKKDAEFADSLDAFTRRLLEKIAYDGSAVLVHGDATNFSNILVIGEKITLLDWEWAIAADPAWEFAGLGWAPTIERGLLAPYFAARGLDDVAQKDFLARIPLYEPLWLLWATHVHASKGGNTDLYEALKTLLVKAIQG